MLTFGRSKKNVTRYAQRANRCDGAIIMTSLESAAGSAVISGERGQSNCGGYTGDWTRARLSCLAIQFNERTSGKTSPPGRGEI